jgi:uncharacterized protein (TIGR03437 family)
LLRTLFVIVAGSGLLAAADPVRSQAAIDWSALVSIPGARIDRIATNRAGSIWLAGGLSSLAPRLGGGAIWFAVFVSRLAPGSSEELWRISLPGGGVALAVDSADNAYIAGVSDQPDSGFIARINPDGRIAWTSRVAGRPSSVGVDGAGGVYVAGVAREGFLTTAGAFKPAIGEKRCSFRMSPSFACDDAFVMKVKADGSGVVWATFVGGTYPDSAHALAVDESGGVYVAGETTSDDFPTTANALQSRFGGAISLGPLLFGDGFVAKISPDGRLLEYSSYLGGKGVDLAEAIAVDAEGVTVGGVTQSDTFPVTANAYQKQYGGGQEQPSYRAGDSFLTRFNRSWRQLFSTYVGGSSYENISAITPAQGGEFYAVTNGPVAALLDQRAPGLCEPASGVIAVNAATGAPANYFSAFNVPVTSIARGVDRQVYAATVPLYTQLGPVRNVARIDFAKTTTLAAACIVNAASFGRTFPSGQDSAAVAAGEIISIGGVGFDAGTRVRFGSEYARLLYAGERQINAVVPMSAKAPATVVIERDNESTPPLAIQVRRAVPGIFTSDGQHAAALNQDGTVNSRENPAAGGSIVSLFATGVLGEHLEAYFAGKGAEILYAGPAPGQIAGLTQINTRVPATSIAGEAVFVLAAGDSPLYALSQDVRLWVKP